VTEEDLRKRFSEAGQVSSVRVIIDKESGRPKGFGFVEFHSSQDAENALRLLQGADICGRPVRLDIPQGKGGGGGGGGGKGDYGRAGNFGGAPMRPAMSTERGKDVFADRSASRSRRRRSSRSRSRSSRRSPRSRSRSKREGKEVIQPASEIA
ncbi:unnamed protein product, partial [Polarella glacialis]